MTQVEAIFRHGKFEPLGPVNLREDEKVTLRIESPELTREERAQKMKEWLEDVRVLRESIAAREGVLPDSTPGIAEDRLR